jgi:hypothetical protein
VHVFLQEIRAFVPPVTVKHPEVAAAWPASLEIRFGDVHNDGDAIFVVVFDEAVKGVYGIPLDDAVGTLYKSNSVDLWHGWPLTLLMLIHTIIFNDYYLNC